MSRYVAISGPCHSGKSTLAMMLSRYYKKNKDIVVIPDLKDKIWQDLVDRCAFGKFEEVFSDRDYLFMYISIWVKEYEAIFEKYDKEEKLVIIDGSHLDILLYAQLHLWFYYPAQEAQSKLITRLLYMDGRIEKIYMVYSDDENFPVERGTLTLRQRMVSFKRSRAMELALYDTYRPREDVYSMLSDIEQSFNIMTKDLENHWGLEASEK